MVEKLPQPETASGEAGNEGEMDLFDHLRELRQRLIYCILAILAGAVVCFVYTEPLFELLTASFKNSFQGAALIATGPAEPFLLRIKTAVFAGAILSSPFLFYQVWLFISPGLYEHEKKMVFPFVGGSTALFLLGAYFCHAVVLPFTFDFFFPQFELTGTTPMIRISEHFAFIIKAIIGFGAVFEMPVLAYFLARLGLIDHLFLIRYFRHAIVLIFLVSAFLTPPDVMTQFMMAVPLIGLYGLSILIVKHTYRERKLEEAAEGG